MELFYLVLIIMILFTIVILVMYNIMLVKRNNVMNAYSSLDVMLKKRYDLVPNLVACVKSYTKHEEKILEKITSIRKEAIATENGKNTFNLNKSLNSNIKELICLKENYPELKANENFLQLQEKLDDIEEYISAARRNYNAHVNSYNTFIGMVPTNVFAIFLGFKKEQLFEIDEDEKINKRWLNNDEE